MDAVTEKFFADFDALMKHIDGCSDGYCFVTGRAKGMHTNGGCKCWDDRTKARRYMQAVSQTVQRFREIAAAPQPPAEAVSGWRPIETAPKDGTVILGWPIYGHAGPREIQWRAWAIVDGQEECWIVCNSAKSKQEVTHWMPLPQPPTEKL